MKKVLALVCALAMTASLFTGFAGRTAKAEEATAEETTAAEETQEEETPWKKTPPDTAKSPR